MKTNFPSHSDLQRAREVIEDLAIEHWYYDDLFSPQWWFLLIAAVLPYYLWWKVVNKERFFEIFTFGLLCSIFSILLDMIGVNLLLWDYPDKLFHFTPPLIPADVVVIPVASMLIYQFCKSWKSFFIAALALAGLFSFIFEPIFIYFHMFDLIHWKHSFSFIGFTILFLSTRLLTNSLIKGIYHSQYNGSLKEE
ncbi:membrane protein implicated in regulation of membrane protease activity [Peribacillus deserti]|uniref:Membrane protein implicated in regulation of membrane protease activity n=1 Tax=Peribacillus deserti TaxID=673318 RepID=A0ABS2QEG9_9BACI|nr:CBO0543 family protein [Peribacillus deserti]MBM7691552.1 membrane protein implicated in regulation of membrane protease activity [Peribacillus deserti]